MGGVFDDITGYTEWYEVNMNAGTADGSIQAAALAKYGPFATWDISQVTDMSYAFSSEQDPSMSEYRPTFNGDMSAWDVSRVINMKKSKYNIHLFCF